MTRATILASVLMTAIGPISLEPAPPLVMLIDVRMLPTVETNIVSEALRQGVPPHLALLCAWRESQLQPNPPDSAYWGLFQLSDRTARVLDIEDPLDPFENTRGAVTVLRMGLDACGSEAGAFRYFVSGRCKQSLLTSR